MNMEREFDSHYYINVTVSNNSPCLFSGEATLAAYGLGMFSSRRFSIFTFVYPGWSGMVDVDLYLVSKMVPERHKNNG